MTGLANGVTAFFKETEMKLLISILLAGIFLAGCASTPPAATSNTAAPAPAPTTSLKTLTHADLQAASKYAIDHGFPARAAMWQAIEAQLTAAENQIAACKAAIEAALPKPSASGGPVGVFTLVEIGAEAVGQGVPANVRINCEPIVIPTGLLPVPKL